MAFDGTQPSFQGPEMAAFEAMLQAAQAGAPGAAAPVAESTELAIPGLPHVGPDDTRLFLAGLPQGTTEAQVREFCGKFGNITELRVITPEGTRGYAFLSFDSSDAVLLALMNAEHNIINGRKVDFQLYNKGKGKGTSKGKGKGKGREDTSSQKDPKVFVGGLPDGVQEADIRAAFQQFGEIVEVKMMRRDDGTLHRYCFLTFDSMETVQKVYDNDDGNMVAGSWVYCRPATSSRDTKGGNGGWDSGKGWKGGGKGEEMGMNPGMMGMMSMMSMMMGMMGSGGKGWEQGAWGGSDASDGWGSSSGGDGWGASSGGGGWGASGGGDGWEASSGGWGKGAGSSWGAGPY